MTASARPAIVDAHHHLWDLSRREYPWMTDAVAPLRQTFTIADLAPELEANRVVQTIVVQAAGSVAETEDLLAAAEASDVIAGVVGWVDLRAGDVAGALARLRRQPGGDRLVGVRHQVHDEPDPEWLLSDEVGRGLAAVADAGLVFDLLVRERELPAARRAVAALPGLRFVLDHAAKPPIAAARWEPWATEVAALSELGNVSCKLSGLVTEADWGSWRPEQLKPYADWVVHSFGPARVLFGSDWPVCRLAASYSQVVESVDWILAGLGDSARQEVFAGNARRTYRLPSAGTAAPNR